jgi:hypothetical protein
VVAGAESDGRTVVAAAALVVGGAESDGFAVVGGAESTGFAGAESVVLAGFESAVLVATFTLTDLQTFLPFLVVQTFLVTVRAPASEVRAEKLAIVKTDVVASAAKSREFFIDHRYRSVATGPARRLLRVHTGPVKDLRMSQRPGRTPVFA